MQSQLSVQRFMQPGTCLCSFAVSYTHLDVYKRQSLYFALLALSSALTPSKTTTFALYFPISSLSFKIVGTDLCTEQHQRILLPGGPKQSQDSVGRIWLFASSNLSCGQCCLAFSTAFNVSESSIPVSVSYTHLLLPCYYPPLQKQRTALFFELLNFCPKILFSASEILGHAGDAV